MLKEGGGKRGCWKGEAGVKGEKGGGTQTIMRWC